MEELRAFVRNEKVFSRKVQNLYLSRMESAANEAAEAGEEFSDQKVGTAFWKEFRSTIPEYENVKKLQNILGRQRMYWNATARRNLAPAGNDVAAIPTANDQLRQAEMESENLKKEIEDDEAIRLYLDELILRKKVALQQKMDLMEKLMREGDATWIERNVVRGNEPINTSPDENYNCVPPSLQELHKQGLAMPVLCKEKEPAMRTHRKNIDMVNVTPTGLSMNLESEGENLDEFADGDRLASQVQIVMTKENGQTPDFKWNQLDHLSLQHDFDFGTELRILGQGAFGFVVWAKKKDTNCPFAVKLMNLKTAQEKNMELHLLREIRIHSQLQHPNIVRLHHYFYDDPEVVLTLDFCERGTLSDAIKEGSLNQTQVAQMLLQLTSAVHYCHDLKGIFHRYKN
jgi:Protein kinase domain